VELSPMAHARKRCGAAGPSVYHKAALTTANS